MVPDTGEFGILIPVILGNVDFAPDDGFDAVTLACRIEISRAVQVAVIGNRGASRNLWRVRINRSDESRRREDCTPCDNADAQIRTWNNPVEERVKRYGDKPIKRRGEAQ